MMIYSLVVWLILAMLGMSDVTPACGPATSLTPPKCVLTFTPWMAPQIGPVSTVYKTIMTTEYNIVDCRYCTVTNIDVNPTPKGPFNTKTTISTLTITRVGCSFPTSIITRRAIQADDYINDLAPRSVAVHAPAVRSTSHHLRRSIQDIAEKVSHNIDPNNSELTVEAYKFLIQLNSAIFALNLINSGFNLTTVCQECRDPMVQLQLSSASLNPKQIGDVVCFASVYGVDFNTTTAELLNDLEAAIYGVQVGSNFTTDTKRLCTVLDLRSGPYLGIDSNGVTQYICRYNNGTATMASTTEVTGIPLVGTETIGTVGSQSGQTSGGHSDSGVGTQASAGTAGTSNPGPYANSSLPASTVWNSGSATMDYSNGTMIRYRLPPTPRPPMIRAAWTTTSAKSTSFKQH